MNRPDKLVVLAYLNHYYPEKEISKIIEISEFIHQGDDCDFDFTVICDTNNEFSHGEICNINKYHLDKFLTERNKIQWEKLKNDK